MRKLLTLISAVGLGATGTVAASNVVSCSKKAANDLSSLKKELLTIKLTDKGDFTADKITDAIVKVLVDNIKVDENGKEIKKDDTTTKPYEITKDSVILKMSQDGKEVTTIDSSKDTSVAVSVNDNNDAAKKALKGTVTFTVSAFVDGGGVKPDLSTVLTVKDSTNLTVAADKNTEDGLKEAIIAKNSGLAGKSVIITNFKEAVAADAAATPPVVAADGSATITSDDFTGSADVTFKIA